MKALETKYRNLAENGVFIHILNNLEDNILDDGTHLDRIEKTISLDAEICASKLTDKNLLTCDFEFSVGLIFKGKAEASFPFDCWSEVREEGTRFPTKKGNRGRSEHWINPSKMTLINIVLIKKDEYSYNYIVDNAMSEIKNEYMDKVGIRFSIQEAKAVISNLNELEINNDLNTIGMKVYLEGNVVNREYESLDNWVDTEYTTVTLNNYTVEIYNEYTRNGFCIHSRIMSLTRNGERLI